MGTQLVVKTTSPGRNPVAMYSKSARTRAKQKRFLDAYEQEGTITHAARAAGMSHTRHYEWLNTDPTYPARFEQSHKVACEALEREARRRAIEGTEEPTGWYQGKPGGFVKRYSDNLLMFLLKGVMPEKYKDRHELTGKDGGPIQTTVESSPIPLDRLSLAAKYLLVHELSGRALSQSLQDMILTECGNSLNSSPLLLPEYTVDGGDGDGNNNGGGVDSVGNVVDAGSLMLYPGMVPQPGEPRDPDYPDDEVEDTHLWEEDL